MLSLRGEGRNSPDQVPQPIAPEDAAAARRQALDHLERAADLGWTDADRLEADEDLTSLRPDPRWAALMRRMRAK